MAAGRRSPARRRSPAPTPLIPADSKPVEAPRRADPPGWPADEIVAVIRVLCVRLGAVLHTLAGLFDTATEMIADGRGDTLLGIMPDTVAKELHDAFVNLDLRKMFGWVAHRLIGEAPVYLDDGRLPATAAGRWEGNCYSDLALSVGEWAWKAAGDETTTYAEFAGGLKAGTNWDRAADAIRLLTARVAVETQRAVDLLPGGPSPDARPDPPTSRKDPRLYVAPLPPSAIAELFDIPDEKLAAFRKALRDWRANHRREDGWTEGETSRRNRERYYYSPAAVAEIIERYRAP
jgi:hypothetical protein